MRSRNLYQVLCFVRTKHGASRLARQLEKDGLITSAIHGDKDQKARLEALEAFKEGKLQVLVATDVAARGLDIDDLPLVVNYELPYVPEDYIHRIGRTGRAGASGEAISFVAPDEERYLSEIERLLKKTVPITVAEGFDPVAGSRREHGERGRVAARGTPGRPTSRGRRARSAPRATRRGPNARRAAKRGPSGRRARTRASSANAPTNSTPTSRCRRRATTRACPAAPDSVRVPASVRAARCPRC